MSSYSEQGQRQREKLMYFRRNLVIHAHLITVSAPTLPLRSTTKWKVSPASAIALATSCTIKHTLALRNNSPKSRNNLECFGRMSTLNCNACNVDEITLGRVRYVATMLEMKSNMSPACTRRTYAKQKQQFIIIRGCDDTREIKMTISNAPGHQPLTLAHPPRRAQQEGRPIHRGVDAESYPARPRPLHILPPPPRASPGCCAFSEKVSTRGRSTPSG